MQIKIKRYSDDYLAGLTDLMNQWFENIHFTTCEIQENINTINKETKSEILLAIGPSENVLGYILISPCYYLGLKPFMEVISFLVDNQNRSKGIGSKLLLSGEEMAKEKGFSHIKLNSRIEREKAHQFYTERGYKELKEAKFFQKKL